MDAIIDNLLGSLATEPVLQALFLGMTGACVVVWVCIEIIKSRMS